jgi:hypothetical protein
MPDADRRRLLACLASAGLSSTLLPALRAQMQPGTREITLAMVRESARLAGLEWTDAECQELTEPLSSLSKGAEAIDKPTLTNASPLPLHFDPRPPGMAAPAPPRAVFRVDAPRRVSRPANLETVAFWPLASLAALIRTRQVTSVELTTMYLGRLKRHNAVLNCVAAGS